MLVVAVAVAVAAAVKIIRPNALIEYFKALRTENSDLHGHHDHIASFMGAYSANIKNIYKLI